MINLNEDEKGRISRNMNRRDFLKLSAMAMGAVALGGIAPLKAEERKKKVFAKSVIYIYLDGGPCHLELFDPKVKAGRDYFGAFRQPIQTDVPTLEICEKLPLLSKLTDKYAVIRSMTHGVNGHETASYIMETGNNPSNDIIYPSIGATIAFKKEQEYKSSIPAYISLTSASNRYNEAGFLGPQYKSFATGGSPDGKNFNVEGIYNSVVNDEKLVRRKKMLESLDNLSKQTGSNSVFEKMNQFREKAYALILGEDRKVFNLNEESDKTRERYGRNHFGQSCLAARRLVEKGVPFITVRNTGWDTHKQHFERMNEKLPELDKALSALLSDLSERGLLDETIVVCGGEFGRTPRVMWEAPWNGGRGHFGAAFCYLVAGGGFEGGKVLGATDPKGEKVIERPVYPCDLTGTIYSLMGIDPNGTLPHPRNGAVKLLPALGGDKSGGILKEIIKI